MARAPARPVPLDVQIRRNKAGTVRLMVLLILILIGLVFSIGYVMGYPPYLTVGFAVVFALVYVALASGFSIPAILKAARARPPNPHVREERVLVQVVEEMAIAAQLPVPKVYVQDSNDINAFATGKSYADSIVCVTTGALRDLDREELQGVIAHEISHIKNYDVRVKTYAVALIGLIAMMGEIVWRMMFFGRGGRDKVHPVVIVIAIALIILAPFLSRMVYFAISRKREYLADSTGAYLTRNPEGLAQALEKIYYDKPEPHHGDRTVSALYFANPFKRKHAGSPWSSHPPLEDRIMRLRGRGPDPQNLRRAAPPPPGGQAGQARAFTQSQVPGVPGVPGLPGFPPQRR